MNRTGRYVLSLVMLVAASTASAQVCNVSMTFQECSQALNNAPSEATLSAAKESFDQANTGSQTGSDTATEDFNPLLQVSVDSNELSASDSSGLTVSWNDFLETFLKNQIFGDDGRLESQGLHHKLTLNLESPEIYEPLKQAITDESIISDLDDSLDDFDSVGIDLRIALNSGKYGRNINNHVSTLDAIQRVSMDQTASQRASMFGLEDQKLQIIQKLGNSWDEDASFESMTDPQTASELVNLMESTRAAHAAYGNAYEAVARQNGLYDLLNMVNNQPQFIFAAKARLRDDIAGPDEYSASLIYEFGSVNVNTYRRFRNNVCGADGGQLSDANEVGCLGNFVRRNGDSIESGNRFALSIEYTHRDSYNIDGFGVLLDLDEETSFVSKLTYGRYLHIGPVFEGVGGRTRFDLSASYDDVSSDPTRQDRAIANATLSQELSDGLFLTASLAWANKPEFRVDGDDDVTARVGISYKLPGLQ